MLSAFYRNHICERSNLQMCNCDYSAYLLCRQCSVIVILDEESVTLSVRTGECRIALTNSGILDSSVFIRRISEVTCEVKVLLASCSA